ncbi:MAG TPA: flagellar basal body rod protein FlgG [Peptococcaceae bacterium]|nr:MAG: hypothetical protein XD50_0125 [Clostridia bacterium 41_269]HBT20165.1 flagellar basal body rod protein FlgG [Peptococcaceae bacterium]
MMRSMFAAVSALRNHQTRMDVIGNNIANVNTVAFKSSRVTFQDVFYQTLNGGSAPSDTRGGINPRQVGTGMTLGTIDTSFTQGNVQPTGIGTDLMIQGDGFFVVGNADGTEIYYTRAGVFGFDSDGNLINKTNGLFVYDVNGNIINVPVDAQSFNIDSYGYVRYISADGEQTEAGQIAIAKFANPEGLVKVGENLFRYDTNAGPEAGGEGNYGGGAPGELGRGTIVASALEMSNVDLAKEFTDMIITQRGYQANARTITTCDEMLEELVNLKR